MAADIWAMAFQFCAHIRVYVYARMYTRVCAKNSYDAPIIFVDIERIYTCVTLARANIIHVFGPI